MSKSDPKKAAWSATVESIITIILGVLLVVWPNTIIKLVAYLVGGFLLVKGGFQIASFMLNKEQRNSFNGELIAGIVTLLIGIVIFAVGEEISHVFRVLVGIWIIYEGLIRLGNAIQLRSAGIVNWSAVMTIAIIMLMFGTFITFFDGAMVFLIGWVLVIMGLIGLFSDVMFMQNTKILIEKLNKDKK